MRRGLYSEGLIYGGKFAFQNRLGWPCFSLFLRAFVSTGSPGGLIFGGAI